MTILMIDANVSFGSIRSPYIGDTTLPPSRGHTPAKIDLALSIFAALEIKAHDTFQEQKNEDDLVTRIGQGTNYLQRTQIGIHRHRL